MGVTNMHIVEVACKNHFKNEPLTKEIYTKIWIELINQLEKSKSGNVQTSKI